MGGVAIDINRETGGNLSEILGQVSDTIRERQRMARHVRTLTAEGRLSARILTVYPSCWRCGSGGPTRTTSPSSSTASGLSPSSPRRSSCAIGRFWVRRIVNSIAL